MLMFLKRRYFYIIAASFILLHESANSFITRKTSVGNARYHTLPLSPAASLTLNAPTKPKSSPTLLHSIHHPSGGHAKFHQDHMTLAGRIFPILSRFVITPVMAHKVFSAVNKEVHLSEFAILAVLAWTIKPVTEFIYCKVPPNFRKQNSLTYQQSKMFFVSRLIGQGLQISCLVYIVDILCIALYTIGFHQIHHAQLSKKAALIGYTLWAMAQLRSLKKVLLTQALKRSKARKGQVALFDRILNLLLYILTGVAIMDFLGMRLGKAFSTVFAFGGVSTLIFSLASKDVAEQLVSGLSLMVTEKMVEGDEVLLEDGTSGIIQRVGWTHTVLRGFDEISMKIPNSQLDQQRVSNISKATMCQVKQKLWFSYDDIDKMPDVIRTIKSEIEAACPKLIKNGSRPFRAHWREYKEDHLEVVVDTHHNLKPTGEAFHDNKMRLLEAIGKATKKCGVEFAIPTYHVKSGGSRVDEGGNFEEGHVPRKHVNAEK